MTITKPERLLGKAGFFLFLSTFLFLSSIAQTTKISGTVIDEKGNKVAGASVLVKNTGIGTSTGSNGSFEFNLPPGADTLVISFIGYAAQEIAMNGRSVINISLTKLESGNLNDVVVVGYGSLRRKDVTGAVASISEKNFNPGYVSNPVEQIQGKVSGLVITKAGGDPNANLIIRLRGQASLTGGQTPLIVVDGVPLDDPTQLQNIPPGDIASYDILKDASASAIYGSRGANGVILIVTKKGNSGKAQVEYNGLVGMDKIAKYLPLLTGAEFKSQLIAQGLDNPSFDQGANNNWWGPGAMTQTGVTQSHILSVSGGSNGFSYRGSVSYLDQKGIVINTGKSQIAERFNAEQRALNNKLVIQVGILNSHVDRNLMASQQQNSVFNNNPTFPVYNPDGSYNTFYTQITQNSVAAQNLTTQEAQESYTQLFGTVNYEVISGLKIGASGGLNYFTTHSDFYLPVLPGVGNQNQASQSYGTNNSQRGDMHINYANTWGKNSLTVTGVYEYNYYVNTSFGSNSASYLIDQLGDHSLGNGNPIYNGLASYKEDYNLVSWLARATYNYDSRYYLTATVRRDFSSKFGVNNQWGNFPSASVAWRISQESFMKKVGWVNELKLSAGYGITGNQDAIGPYSTLLTYGAGGKYFDAATGTYTVSYSPTQNPNPDLKWEERHGTNIGLDFSLFNSRLTGNINYFNDKTENLLYNYTVPTPPFYVNTILANVGSMTNKGVEIQLSGDAIRKKDFTWNIGGQITFVKTRIDELSGNFAGIHLTTDHIPAGSDWNQTVLTYLQVGYTPSVFHLLHYMGVDQSGTELFDNGTGGKVTFNNTTEAMKRYIDPSPKFTYGISNTFNYKTWSLNFFLRGVYGEKIFNSTRELLQDVNRFPSLNVIKEAFTDGIKDGSIASDRYLENASFLRLDNITLSYNFSHVPGFSNLRVYVTGNNLFVITHYTGFDPEVQPADGVRDTNFGPSNLSYIDQAASTTVRYFLYPRSRSVSFGVNLTLK